VLVAFLSACYPTLPPTITEGTDILAPGHVSLNIAGGAGDFSAKGSTGAYENQFAGGLEARLRTGIGARSEIGASLIGGVGTSVGGGDPPFVLGGKVSYKLGLLPALAFVVDAGAMDYAVASVAIFSGDFAVIAAPYTSPTGLQLYVAAKGGFAVPVLSNATNVNEMITIPVGVQIPTSQRVRFYIEAGPLAGFAQQSSGGTTSSTNTFGGYGTVAFAFVLR
jgi:hypothetical protein